MITLLQTFILLLIHMLTPHSSGDELDMNLKFVDELNVENIEVETDTGWQPIRKIFKTRDYEIYHIETESGLQLDCADLHRLFDENMNIVYANELIENISFIQTKFGPQRVTKVKRTGKRVQMYDIEVDSPDHRYYSNSILSHNTTTTAIFFTHFLLFNTDKSAAIAAQRDQIAGEIFSKVKSIISYMPFFLKPGCINFARTSFAFDNGCKALFRPATVDCLQGYTIDLLFVDEFAYIKQKKAREFWDNVYPTLSSMKNSRVIICSTPNGRNLYYDMWTKAIEGKNLFKTFRVDWWEVPGRDEAWKQQEIANLGSEEAFEQQYGLSFDTGIKNALSATTYHYLNKISTIFNEGLLKIGTDFDEFFRWSLKWKYNLRNDWFLISVDIGEGLNSDYSTIKIRKLFLNENSTIIMPTIGVFECNTIQIPDYAKVILQLMKRFNNEHCRLVIERNTYGDLLMTNIDNFAEKMPNHDIDLETFAKFKRSADAKFEKGLRLNRQSKKIGVAAWKQLVDDKIFIETDSKTIDQYREFGEDTRGNYKASIGHDDLVMPDVDSAFYVKSDNNGWTEFVDEFKETVQQDQFNINVMNSLELTAINAIRQETTLDGNEYDFIISADDNDSLGGGDEYSLLDKLLKKDIKSNSDDEYSMLSKLGKTIEDPNCDRYVESEYSFIKTTKAGGAHLLKNTEQTRTERINEICKELV